MPAPYQPEKPSFSTLLQWEGRKAWGNHARTAWALDRKDVAYAFARDLGLKVPRLPIPLQSHVDVPLMPGTVVKPLDALMSTGVILVFRDHLVDLATNDVLVDEGAARARMGELVSQGRVKSDEWIVEEMVMSDHDAGQAARDLKFYCFYGRVGLMLETVRRPEVRRCWYDVNHQRVETGKYSNVLFEGHGIPQRYVDTAVSISLEVPAPFIRVDFLASAEGPVFNEITPKPGGSHLLNRRWDIRLGNSMLAAARRLHEDLLDGRQFEAFLRHAA